MAKITELMKVLKDQERQGTILRREYDAIKEWLQRPLDKDDQAKTKQKQKDVLDKLVNARNELMKTKEQIESMLVLE